jgi:hypothetical protein
MASWVKTLIFVAEKIAGGRSLCDNRLQLSVASPDTPGSRWTKLTGRRASASSDQ